MAETREVTRARPPRRESLEEDGQSWDIVGSPESPEFWSAEKRQKELFTDVKKCPWTKGGDFGHVALEGGWGHGRVDW